MSVGIAATASRAARAQFSRTWGVYMKFRSMSKDLSAELENLFATLGHGAVPEETERLDPAPCVQAILERMKSLDAPTPNADDNAS